MIKAQTLKGFRDFLPADAIKRHYVIGKIRESFERYGFDPLETPALEYAETLLGKYGDEADKLLYTFEDRGGRAIGMRYDQTVPTARVVAQYAQDLPMPFKRYQIQPVWRAENPQKGRFREFLQCDADIFGEPSYLADAEIIALLGNTLSHLGFAGYTILINDRTLFGDTPLAAIGVIDKLNKIGAEGVKTELADKGFDPGILDTVKGLKPSERLMRIMQSLKTLGVDSSRVRFDPTLARGLDYYTSTIVEAVVEGYEAGSVCGGGRYDKLIGQFSGRDVPAIGFAFGFDRLVEAMDQLGLLPATPTKTRILVTVFSESQLPDMLSLTAQLRQRGINTDIALAAGKLEKQLKFADRKGIPYVVIQGPEEQQNNTVILKTMLTKEQKTLSVKELIGLFSGAS